ncbi:hypothetical protein [Cryobacterium roopkundense]|uniref:Polysaccharide chain length determinant N-terminal domain-containing protein n=1 Tax=Cryobacterium roopkundense TaxID=1001240 RepID=A0A7W8ZZ82_9MICO|nr:hypothetical protein [Cryobacterium roopkundense]MBB5642778.1 hypothetical protein [Cryobacterium roopkundense]
MTLNQIFRACARRWYILLGLAILTGFGAVLAAGAGGVYWTRVDVIFLEPSSSANPNALRAGTGGNLVAFAALVERQVNGNLDTPRFSNVESTLYGAGVRQGSRVSLANTGGQWADAFTRPVLSVEVVDSSETAVRSTLGLVLAHIDRISAEQQADAGVPQSSQITTLASPQQAVISRAEGKGTRAGLAVLVLGLALAGAVTAGADRFLTRRARNRESSPF